MDGIRNLTSAPVVKSELPENEQELRMMIQAWVLWLTYIYTSAALLDLLLQGIKARLDDAKRKAELLELACFTFLCSNTSIALSAALPDGTHEG